jgi:hypothetical protein
VIKNPLSPYMFWLFCHNFHRSATIGIVGGRGEAGHVQPLGFLENLKIKEKRKIY